MVAGAGVADEGSLAHWFEVQRTHLVLLLQTSSALYEAVAVVVVEWFFCEFYVDYRFIIVFFMVL